MLCYHCPIGYRETPRQWTPTELRKHVEQKHPETVDPKMPECPNCGMPCEAGRHPLAGWLCHYCNLSASQGVCPTCRSVVERKRIREKVSA